MLNRLQICFSLSHRAAAPASPPAPPPLQFAVSTAGCDKLPGSPMNPSVLYHPAHTHTTPFSTMMFVPLQGDRGALMHQDSRA